MPAGGGSGSGAPEGFRPAEATQGPKAEVVSEDGAMKALEAQARATGDLVDEIAQVAPGVAKNPPKITTTEAPEALDALAGVEQPPAQVAANNLAAGAETFPSGATASTVPNQPLEERLQDQPTGANAAPAQAFQEAEGPVESEQASLQIGEQTAQEFMEGEQFGNIPPELRTATVDNLNQALKEMATARPGEVPSSWYDVVSYIQEQQAREAEKAAQAATPPPPVARPAEPPTEHEVHPAPTAPEVPTPVTHEEPQPPQTPVAPPPPLTPTPGVPRPVEAKINDVNNADGAPNADRVARQQEYAAAQAKIQQIESKAEDQRTDQEKSDLETAHKTVSRTERDADFELKREAVQQGGGDEKSKAEAMRAIDEAQVKAWQGDVLEADTKYQDAKKLIDAHPDWKAKDAKDIPKAQQKEFEQYENARRSMMTKEHAAEVTAREKLIAADPSLTAEQRKAKTAQLEQYRRQLRKGDLLHEDKQYQKLSREVATTEADLRSFGLTDADLQTLGREGVAGLAGDEKKYKAVSEYARIHGKDFKRYLDTRMQMNERESIADIAAAHERYDQGIDDNGQKMEGTPNEVKKKISEAKSKKNKDFDPAKGFLWPKRLWYGLNKKIDWAFGKEERKHQGQRFTKSVKLLSGYGVKGFVPWFLMPKGVKDRDNIKSLQKEAFKGAWGWGWRSGMRLGIWALFLSGAFWLVMPIVAGKVIDMTKPFGGNA